MIEENFPGPGTCGTKIPVKKTGELSKSGNKEGQGRGGQVPRGKRATESLPTEDEYVI